MNSGSARRIWMIAALVFFPACSSLYALLKVHSSLKLTTSAPVPPLDHRRADLEEATSSKMNGTIITRLQERGLPANQSTTRGSQRTSQLAQQDRQHCRVDKPPIAPKTLRKGIRSKYTDEQYYQNAMNLVQSIQTLIAVGQKHLYGSSDFALHNYRIMDYGCGGGRLLVGLQAASVCYQKYLGVDIRRREIEWLAQAHPDNEKHRFVHINIHNKRYNPRGKTLKDSSLGLDPNQHGQFDLIVLRSVFSHMLADDIQHHLRALRPFLADGGVMYVSLFVRDDLDGNQVENPGKETTPLHVVVIRRQAFEQMVVNADYHILLFTTVSGQQTYLLAPGKQRDPQAQKSLPLKS